MSELQHSLKIELPATFWPMKCQLAHRNDDRAAPSNPKCRL